MRRRELIGLAGLVLALGVAFPIAFLRTNDNSAPVDPAAATSVAGTARAVGPTPTPTPLPDRGDLSPPSGWSAVFHREVGGARVAEPPVFIKSLDLRFDTAPFADYREGSWGVDATSGFADLAPGRYVVVLRYDASVRLFVNDQLIAEAADPPAERELR